MATAVTQSVTHQGSPLPTSDAVLVAVPSPVAAAAAPAASAPPAQPCMSIPTSSASAPATPASPAVPAAGVGDPVLMLATTATLTVPTLRCHWCHKPCAARVRLDCLRHSRPARRASARVAPSHGHKPLNCARRSCACTQSSCGVWAPLPAGCTCTATPCNVCSPRPAWYAASPLCGPASPSKRGLAARFVR